MLLNNISGWTREDMVLTTLDDWRLLAELHGPGSEYAAAYARMLNPPVRRRVVRMPASAAWTLSRSRSGRRHLGLSEH